MSTTQKTTQAGTFDPSSMGTFQEFMKNLGPQLSGFASNPFGTQQFKLGQQLGNSQAHNLGQTAMSQLTNNMTGSGMAGGASNPAATEMMNNQARQNTNTTANLGFIQPTQNALNMQQNALGTEAAFKPLQTGGTNTQSTQGLGTWLPQLIGAGLGLAGNIATGGASGLASGLFGAANPQMQGFQGGNIGGALPTGGFAGVNLPPAPTGNSMFAGGQSGFGGGITPPSWFGGGSSGQFMPQQGSGTGGGNLFGGGQTGGTGPSGAGPTGGNWNPWMQTGQGGQG